MCVAVNDKLTEQANFPSIQLEPNGALLPLDAGAASPPALNRTWFISLLLSLFDRVASGKKNAETEESLENSDSDMPSVDDTGDSDGKAAATDGLNNGRARVAKVGGRRRKTAQR